MVSLAGVAGVLRGIPLQHQGSHQVLALLLNANISLPALIFHSSLRQRIDMHVTLRFWHSSGLGTLSWVSYCLLSACTATATISCVMSQ